MKIAAIRMLLVVAVLSAGAAQGQLQALTNPAPQSVFFGNARGIAVTFHNPDAQEFKQDVRVAIFQTTSDTVAPLGEKPWKELRVLPHQTVLESAPLSFPEVRAETKFLIDWVYGKNTIIGRTEVMVYPTNLLHELALIQDGNEDNLGLLDPDNRIKPTLRQAAIRFIDLGDSEVKDFTGKLAIFGPFDSKTQMRDGLVSDLKSLAAKGAGVVWIQPPRMPKEPLRPSFCSIRETTNALVVVQPDLLAGFAENPQSQLNLLNFCKMALHPEPIGIPISFTQP